MEENSHIGRLVFSKSGRDKDKFFIIVGILNEEYVYISDGRLRRVEKPKKKKVKHLGFTNIVADEIKEMLLSNSKVSNSLIREFLQSHDMNKEV